MARRPVVIINPGTGPVDDANAKLAIAAAHQMLIDVAEQPTRRDEPKLSGVTFKRLPERDFDGRFGFLFELGERSCTVDIPGIAIDSVRYIDKQAQNIWHYPRLYINDSSFVWFYVITLIREELSGRIDE